MKKMYLYLLFACLFVSCIQEEAKNAEADILSCIVLDENLAEEIQNVMGNMVYTNNRVMIQARSSINLTKLALDLEVTPGASVFPNPDNVEDFSEPREYTVTSESGEWKKKYMISIDTFSMPIDYRFDNYELDNRGKYHVFFEKVAGTEFDSKQYIWASGNSGYNISGQAKKPEDFPTVNVAGIEGGRAARLVTRTTGGWGALLGMPIAAGNLFIGSFDGTNAVAAPLKSTLFGMPFNKKPLRFEGKYCYQAGTEFTNGVDENKEPQIITYLDSCDIYAVLYESEGLEKESLNGADVLTSQNIVAIARVKNAEVMAPSDHVLLSPEYKSFEVKFDYDTTDPITWPSFMDQDKFKGSDGQLRTFDAEKLKDYKYNLAVVFTSSRYGAGFAGALNSTLYIDNVKVICE